MVSKSGLDGLSAAFGGQGHIPLTTQAKVPNCGRENDKMDASPSEYSK